MRAREVLLVEDSRSDARLIERWLADSEAVQRLRTVRDGEAALELLRREQDSPERPALVLLDVNLPGMNGFDVLSQIREDPRLEDLAVIILTGTVGRGDVERAQALRADRCLPKPSDADEFIELIGAIEELCRGLDDARGGGHG